MRRILLASSVIIAVLCQCGNLIASTSGDVVINSSKDVHIKDCSELPLGVKQKIGNGEIDTVFINGDIVTSGVLKNVMECAPKLKALHIEASTCIDNGVSLANVQWHDCQSLTELYIDNLITLDPTEPLAGFTNELLSHCPNLRTASFNSLKKVGDGFLTGKEKLVRVSLESLEEAGKTCLTRCPNLETVVLDRLQKVGNYFLNMDRSLVAVSLPSLNWCGDLLLGINAKLENVNLASLEIAGNLLLNGARTLKKVNVDRLKIVGNASFNKTGLEEVNFPALESVGYRFLADSEHLCKVTFSNSQTTKDESPVENEWEESDDTEKQQWEPLSKNVPLNIGPYFLAGSNVGRLIFKKEIAQLGEHAFEMATDRTRLFLPNPSEDEKKTAVWQGKKWLSVKEPEDKTIIMN